MPVHPEATPLSDPGSVRGAWRLAWTILALALLATAFAVDPGAEAAFDAPKQLALLLGAAGAGAVWLWQATTPAWRTWSIKAKFAVAMAILLALWLAIATLVSSQPELSWTAARRALLVALLLPLGASRLLAGAHGRRLFAVAAAAVLVNALVSLAQLAGWQLPLAVTEIGGRFASGALLGNEGYVALACALLASACLAWLLFSPDRRTRGLALLALLPSLAAIAGNRQTTALLALTLAGVIIIALRWRRLWLLWGAIGVLALTLTTATLPALRAITWGALPVAGVAGFQRITTYRLGAWVAAEEMIRARPLSGYGPGTFGAHSQTSRLAAEIRLRERFVQPLGGFFAHAHNDYLELAAESGMPALLAALAGIGAVLYGLARRLLRRPDTEAAVLMAMLVTGGIAALAWFPLHIPLLAMILLLALGRAWRLVAARPEATT